GAVLAGERGFQGEAARPEAPVHDLTAQQVGDLPCAVGPAPPLVHDPHLAPPDLGFRPESYISGREMGVTGILRRLRRLRRRRPPRPTAGRRRNPPPRRPAGRPRRTAGRASPERAASRHGPPRPPTPAPAAGLFHPLGPSSHISS